MTRVPSRSSRQRNGDRAGTRRLGECRPGRRRSGTAPCAAADRPVPTGRRASCSRQPGWAWVSSWQRRRGRHRQGLATAGVGIRWHSLPSVPDRARRGTRSNPVCVIVACSIGARACALEGISHSQPVRARRSVSRCRRCLGPGPRKCRRSARSARRWWFRPSLPARSDAAGAPCGTPVYRSSCRSRPGSPRRA